MTAPVDTLATALADRYRIAHEIGAGGMATVYLAHDIKHDRDVAIKVLHPDLGAALGGERFLAEIKTTAKLQHPHILPLLDSGDAGNGLLYYVMPLVVGESLRARLQRERQLPIPEAVRIAREVASALDYAHRHGVIHRDIKPENILLHDGQAIVADFGIALAVQSAGGARLTQTGLSLGTPSYMSPEQAMGEKIIDARSDIYALGAVTYEMLSGDAPFTGSSVQAIVAKVLTERPTPLHTLRDTVPPHVEHAVFTALAKLPADRFATAAEFAMALEGNRDASAYRAVASNAPTARIRAREFAAWMLFAAATASLVWTLTRSRAISDAPVIRTSFDAPSADHLPSPASGNFALSPLGDRIAFFVQDSAGTRIVVRRSDEQTGHEIPVDALSNFNVTFSPNGEWLAYTDGVAIKKVRVDGGASVPVGTELTFKNWRGLSWTRADTILIGAANGIWMVPADGGVIKRAIVIDSLARHYWPVASPDAELLAFITGKTPDQLKPAVMSLRDRTVEILDIPVVAVLGFREAHLIYVNPQGAVMALPFDARHLRATGDPVQVDDGVRVGDAATGAAATLSESGTLAYLRGTSTNVLVTSAPGHADTRILSDAGFYKNPRYSPDGKQIAIAIGSGSSGDIWVYDIALRTMRQLTTERTNGVPEWTPDGKRILFRSQRAGAVAIWSQPADGSAKSEMLYQPDDQVNEAILSPDRQWLVYRSGPATRHPSDIFAMRLDSARQPITLVEGPSADVMPRLSPDGKWLAYESDRTGRDQIYVQPFPTLGAPVKVSTDGGREPVWAKSGEALYYRTQTGSVVSVAVKTGATLSLGDRRTALPGDYVIDHTHAGYDVSPDGNSFLMLKPSAGEAKPTIVYNWGRELKEKLAGRKK